MDVWALGSVVALILAVGVAASLIPALRAARVEPGLILRAE
jgi:ABC-type lipoprotein release transport system permease subunit